ncbi:hypothetical protein GOV14_04305 [Candidatus Pacearchaeota archaeon]|nr:hypothetical protein [Candidatus Pacearchaeota archaeon]
MQRQKIIKFRDQFQASVRGVKDAVLEVITSDNHPITAIRFDISGIKKSDFNVNCLAYLNSIQSTNGWGSIRLVNKDPLNYSNSTRYVMFTDKQSVSKP